MKTVWGTYQEQEIFLYTLENECLRVEISNFGGIIRSLFVKDFNRDIVLGYENLEEYIEDGNYIGCVIGRNANRVEKGKFTLGNKMYQLNVNNGPNHLHGGITGFNKRVFDVIDEQPDSLTLHYLSPHKEEYYPGNLDFSVTFTLDEDHLILRYTGMSDQRTLFNPTHHSYFNLSGEADIGHHELSIDADRFAPLDKDAMALYPLHKAAGAMDFGRFARLGPRLTENLETIQIAQGLDHHFERKCDTQHPFIRLRAGSFNLCVTTDAPGAQIYTGNYLTGKQGKDGFVNGKHAGICLETQFYPNNINNDSKIKGILEAFEEKELTTQFRFYRKEEIRHE